jgi:hypothetical protein
MWIVFMKLLKLYSFLLASLLFMFSSLASAGSSNAFQIIEVSAKSGNAAAQYSLGMFYYFGEKLTPEVKQDYFKAADWFEKSVKQGNPNAQYQLAVLYSTGKGVKKNEVRAEELYLDAAIQGLPSAVYMIGLSYEFGGKSIKQDTPKALMLYGEACDMKYQPGCDAYARLKK